MSEEQDSTDRAAGTLTPEIIKAGLDELWWGRGPDVAEGPGFVVDLRALHAAHAEQRAEARMRGILREEARRERERLETAREAGERDRREWIAGVKARLGLVVAGDLPSCECIAVSGGYITNACLLHNPADGILVKRPVQFTGLLSVLSADDAEAPGNDHGDAPHE